ncbi:MAG: glycoside hydrolase family 25 protein [Sphingomonadales bacterium]|nr:glycoside hydrolase family 25 protein [Sphingomonadales bacterium]MBD3773925.1 glycoside hydrolase family 25 protein [Paracoccaceae bacterium]
MTEQPGAAKPERRRKTKWGCGILLAPLLVGGFWAVLQAPHWHPSDADYPLQGIDVSHHQGQIAWAKLPAQGVDFAWIKATEGGDHVDSAFAANWQGARDAGIRHGAYHFFTLCRPGAEQAANFIATVPVEADALPPVVDLEYLGNCGTRPGQAGFDAELTAFLAAVEAHYGQRAVLYLTEEFDRTYHVSARFDRPLWLRSLLREPDFGGRFWTVWQASNFRRLDGIEGRVDWNVVRNPAQPTRTR